MNDRNLEVRFINDFVVVDEDEDAETIYELCVELDADLVVTPSKHEDGSSALCVAPPIYLRDQHSATVGEVIGSRDFAIRAFDDASTIPSSHKGHFAILQPSLGGDQWAELDQLGVFEEPKKSSHSSDDSETSDIIVNVQAPAIAKPGEAFDIEVSLDLSVLDQAVSELIDAELDHVLRCRLSTIGAGGIIDGSPKDIQFSGDKAAPACIFQAKAPDHGSMVWIVRLYHEDGTLAASLQASVEVNDVATYPSTSQKSSLLSTRPMIETRAEIQLVITMQHTIASHVLAFEAIENDELYELGEQQIGSSPEKGVSQIFAELGLLPGGVESTDDREFSIEQISETVWNSFLSTGAKEFLFERANVNEPRTLLIETGEPWIPWEMASVTTNLDDGTAVQKGHLCELFDVAREAGRAAAQFEVGRIGWVCVRDSNLTAATMDRQAIENATKTAPSPRLEDIKANPTMLKLAFASGEFDMFHFVGHGATQLGREFGASVLQLEKGLRFPSIAIVSSVIEGLMKRRPFVFLNTCNAGAQRLEFGKTAGWAEKFMEGGAGAFLGCHWAVTDELAGAFAMAFYAEIQAGHPIAKAVRIARQAIRKEGDPTWLAYTLHGNPNATFTFTSPGGPEANAEQLAV